MAQGAPPKGRKKTPEELACEILQHFFGTARGFHTQLAKAIHQPTRRQLLLNCLTPLSLLAAGHANDA